MTLGSRICPHCGKLNAADDSRCGYCERRVPAGRRAALIGLWERVSGQRSGATLTFSALSVLVYLALWLGSGTLGGSIDGLQALHWGALVGDLGHVEPWRYLSAMFVHFNLLHVGFNVLALYSLGRGLEGLTGSARFTLLFLLTGVCGFIVSDLWYAEQPLTGGISGGIFGLLGAEVGLRHAVGDDGWKRAAITGLGYAAAMALLPGQTANNAAHVGGLASGAVIGWVLSRSGRGARIDRVYDGLALLLLIATFASIIGSRLEPLPRTLQLLS
ncbi:MAG TPA: rhomboid family intramembrane serine protease [Polyangiaceae bacterium]|nr:rhomboid family intramembrane serine protease [Polyangiaceae bacterium]